MVEETEIAATRELMKELGHLPLAIIQSTAYLNVEPMPISKYLENSRKKHEESLWTFRPLRPIEELFYVPVGIVLSLSLERIQNNNVALQLLCLISFLHPDTIPVALLTWNPIAELKGSTWPFSDENQLKDTLRLLAAYQFIRRSVDAISVHRLVQHTIRDILCFDKTGYYALFSNLPENDQYWIERAIELVWIVYPEQPGPENWGICTDLYLHASTAVEHAKTLEYTTSEAISLEGALGGYMIDYGLYEKAENLFRHLLSVEMNLYGEDHIGTAHTIQNLGNTYYSQGKYEDAIAQYERALKIFEKAFGVDHINTADPIHNLGNTYSRQGKYEDAIAQYERALNINEKSFEVDHINPDHPIN